MSNIKTFENFNSKLFKNNPKAIKLKKLLEDTLDADIMYHEERDDYFFEWHKDNKFITIWLSDYIEK